MTQHILSRDSLLPGETSADAFRRLAHEKPGKGGACFYCGQDHRGPAHYWPQAELEAHNRAIDKHNEKVAADVRS